MTEDRDMTETKTSNDRLISDVSRLRERYAEGRMSRRGFLNGLFALGLGGGAVAAVMGSVRPVRADDAAPEVVWDGKVFDAGGETMTIAHWGGEMQTIAERIIISQFEKDYNCKVRYDADWPWFGKMSLAGPDNPPIDLYGGNLPESFNLESRGFFTSQADLKANVPNVADMWEKIAFYGPGVIWALHIMGVAYRTDIVNPAPTALADMWKPEFAGKRSIYTPINDLQAILFMSIAKAFGKDQYDMQTAFDKLKAGAPWIVSPFTGETMNLMERGEVTIGWQTDGEALLQKERGLPINWVKAKEVAPFNVMHFAVSKGSSPIRKKLAYALLDRYCSPQAGTDWSQELYLHPVNLKSTLAEKKKQLGYKGTEADFADLFFPDWKWYIANQTQIVDTTNAILSS
jgi:putative spermidine/putrescine transport system substrate-binding protein